MERSKHIIMFISFMVCFNNLFASYKSDIYNSYINSNMTQWVKVIDEMYLQKDKSNEFNMELINYQYGYIGWCIEGGKAELAKKYLSLAEDNLGSLERSRYKLSLVNSYKAAFYGYRIALNKFKAPFLGSKCVDCARLAIKLDQQNPCGYLQYGNSEYYRPPILGGSKTVALTYFKKAEELMQLDTNQIKEDWNYLNLLMIMALAYEDTKNYELAKAYYQKILKIEPNFLRVKNILYPQFLKKNRMQ